jgi:hypothetical protein
MKTNVTAPQVVVRGSLSRRELIAASLRVSGAAAVLATVGEQRADALVPAVSVAAKAALKGEFRELLVNVSKLLIDTAANAAKGCLNAINGVDLRPVDKRSTDAAVAGLPAHRFYSADFAPTFAPLFAGLKSSFKDLYYNFPWHAKLDRQMIQNSEGSTPQKTRYTNDFNSAEMRHLIAVFAKKKVDSVPVLPSGMRQPLVGEVSQELAFQLMRKDGLTGDMEKKLRASYTPAYIRRMEATNQNVIGIGLLCNTSEDSNKDVFWVVGTPTVDITNLAMLDWQLCSVA